MPAQPVGQAPLEFIFQDDKTNKTIVLEGYFEPIDIPSLKPVNITTTTLGTPLLDGPTGPMLYVLAVILVYGLSMFLIVGTLARKKSYHKQLDVEVGRYVKGLEKARQEARLQEVQKLRINWPGNFVKSPDDEFSSDNENDDDEDEYIKYNATTRNDSFRTHTTQSGDSQEESDDYTELPATTVIYIDEVTSVEHSPAVTPEQSDDAYSGKDLLHVPPTVMGGKVISQTSISPKQNSTEYFNEFSKAGLQGSTFSMRDATYFSTENISQKSASSLEIGTSKKDSNRTHASRALSLGHLKPHNPFKHKGKGNKLTKNPKLTVESNSGDISIIKEQDTKTKSKRLLPNGRSLDNDNEETPPDESHTPVIKKRKKKISILKRQRKTSFFHPHLFSHHDKHGKTGDSAESETDTELLEEYRNSKFYKLRQSRGRRGNVVINDLNDNLIGNHSGNSSPHLSLDNLKKTGAIGTPGRTKKISTVSSPMAFLHSDSDIDDPYFEKYKHSSAYQSRNRGRKGVLF